MIWLYGTYALAFGTRGRACGLVNDGSKNEARSSMRKRGVVHHVIYVICYIRLAGLQTGAKGGTERMQSPAASTQGLSRKDYKRWGLLSIRGKIPID